MPGWPELIVIGAIALLVFGRRLPDVARSVGKSIVEFKKGLKDVKNEIDVQSRVDAPAAKIEHKPETTMPAETTPEPAPKQEQAPSSQ